MEVDMKLFWQEVGAAEHILLATSKDDVVTVRPVAGVRSGNEIIIRTDKNSRKTAQISVNPNVGVGFGLFYMQGRARELGDCNDAVNIDVKNEYIKRFTEAFSEKDGYLDGSEVFIAIQPTKINQWLFEDGKAPELAESFL